MPTKKSSTDTWFKDSKYTGCLPEGEEAETAARNNFSGNLYQLTRKIAKQGRNMTTTKDDKIMKMKS